MLKLRNIYKSYKYDKQTKIILDNINLDFKKNEMVFILGKSGSGKSTLLNIIGGLLKCDKGNIYINQEDITKLSSRKMDNYRNNFIGYIFQDYNLIDYMSVYDNIMLCSSNKDNQEYLDNLLDDLEILDKKKVLVKKLSGGEKQRVAIARALINNPEIILADEPTGALDSINSKNVIEILKKVSKNKLVIVVTHDIYLAKNYADRIINICDGKVEYEEIKSNDKFDDTKKGNFKKRKLFKLAIKNLWLKKGRTLITSLAITLGICSILMVLNLASNFKKEINILEEEIVSIFPININNSDYEINSLDKKSDKEIILKNDNKVNNIITNDYISYLESINEISYMTIDYDISMPIISNKYKSIDNSDMRLIPNKEYIEDNYDLLYGNMPNNEDEILLVVDSNNNVKKRILNYFNIDDDTNYEDIINMELGVVSNNEYFINKGDYFIINSDNNSLFNNSKIKLKIVGIIREKEVNYDESYFYYDSSIIKKIININEDSEIVRKQISVNYNVLGDTDKKEDLLSYLGYKTLPNNINLYFKNIHDKEIVITLLDKYNTENSYIKYTDTMKETIEVINNFIRIISIILIGFSVITVIVSLIMIGILTNIRVLERKKEIGILRSIGASKKNIISLFNMENIGIGILSSILSLIILYLLMNPVNKILYNLLELDNMMKINIKITVVILVINVIVIKIAGSIPSRRASKLDIVKCIYDK